MIAAVNTNTTGSSGAISYVFVNYFKNGGKFSVVSACKEVIAGLVGVRPAAGYVLVWCGAAMGLITGMFIGSIQDLIDWIGIGGCMELFKLHGMGGIMESFSTGIFATSSVLTIDGLCTMTPGGIDDNRVQVGKQCAEIVAIASYSFLFSLILCNMRKYIPGMLFRVTDEAEMMGMDLDQSHDEQIGDRSLFETPMA